MQLVWLHTVCAYSMATSIKQLWSASYHPKGNFLLNDQEDLKLDVLARWGWKKKKKKN